MYLTRPKYDAVLILRAVVLVVFQLLPLNAHRHGPQLLVHAKVVNVL